LGLAQDLTRLGVHGNGITAGQHLLGTEQVQASGERGQPVVGLAQAVSGLFTQALVGQLKNFPSLFKKKCRTDTRQAHGEVAHGEPLLAGGLVDAAEKTALQIIELLQPILQPAPGMQPV
jgi:hypothetical protein